MIEAYRGNNEKMELLLVDMAKEASATEVKINPQTGHVSLNLTKEKRKVILSEWREHMSDKGLKLKTEYLSEGEDVIEVENPRKGKTTEPRYVNANNQKNHGRKEKSDNHYNQWFYEMECLECGHRYNANGSDIWLRKCPKCQGGRP